MNRTGIGARFNNAFSVVHWRNVPLMILLLIGAFLMVLPFLWMAAPGPPPFSPGESASPRCWP